MSTQTLTHTRTSINARTVAFIPVTEVRLARRLFRKKVTRILVKDLPNVVGRDPWQVMRDYAWDQDFDGDLFLEYTTEGPLAIFVPRGMEIDITDISGIDPRSIPDPEDFEWLMSDESLDHDRAWEVAA